MKRNLFDEMKEGFDALQSARVGDIILRHHVVEKFCAPPSNSFPLDGGANG
jgi:hypothetical protein